MVAAAALAGCSGGREAPAPSADAGRASRCAGIAEPLARFVCEDADLRAIDADASRLYQRVLAYADHTAKGEFRAAHDDWRRDLAGCLDVPEARRWDCLDERYNARIVALSRQLEDL